MLIDISLTLYNIWGNIDILTVLIIFTHDSGVSLPFI